MKNSHSESYAAAGVDVTAGYEAVERIKPMVESTYIPACWAPWAASAACLPPTWPG